MLTLPNVTLIALTNQDFDGHKHAIDESCRDINFGAVKLIWDEKCISIDEWNRKIIYELHNYVDTEFAFLIHADGYVINPQSWRDEWLKLDYIGSPWPLPQDDFSYRSESGKIQRVGNSVSLRSKRLMELVATTSEDYFWSFKDKYGNCNEDGFICCHNREWLESQGMKFATFEQAIKFGKEVPLPENEGLETFAFHSL